MNFTKMSRQELIAEVQRSHRAFQCLSIMMRVSGFLGFILMVAAYWLGSSGTL